MYLGIEIGGTKLQLGVGRGDGDIAALWRGAVDPAAGGEGIRRQILATVPELLSQAKLDRGDLAGVGVGFGGPTDDATQTVIKSHHIAGWDGFPLADWLTDALGLPTTICNDADVAGLAEALFGAGKGLSPIFYITVGTGIGGGLIIDGEIYRGVGKGAAEIGHVRPVFPILGRPHDLILEGFASGTGLAHRREELVGIEGLPRDTGRAADVRSIAEQARKGDAASVTLLDHVCQALAENICTVIKLLCPRRIVIGGGVSLVGEELFFRPIRRYVTEREMAAFAGLTDIVPAALGEAVVVHGALALARRRFGG